MARVNDLRAWTRTESNRPTLIAGESRPLGTCDPLNGVYLQRDSNSCDRSEGAAGYPLPHGDRCASSQNMATSAREPLSENTHGCTPADSQSDCNRSRDPSEIRTRDLLPDKQLRYRTAPWDQEECGGRLLRPHLSHCAGEPRRGSLPCCGIPRPGKGSAGTAVLSARVELAHPVCRVLAPRASASTKFRHESLPIPLAGLEVRMAAPCAWQAGRPRCTPVVPRFELGPSSDLTETRTRVFAVRGRRPDHWTMRSCAVLHVRTRRSGWARRSDLVSTGGVDPGGFEPPTCSV